MILRLSLVATLLTPAAPVLAGQVTVLFEGELADAHPVYMNPPRLIQGGFELGATQLGPGRPSPGLIERFTTEVSNFFLENSLGRSETDDVSLLFWRESAAPDEPILEPLGISPEFAVSVHRITWTTTQPLFETDFSLVSGWRTYGKKPWAGTTFPHPDSVNDYYDLGIPTLATAELRLTGDGIGPALENFDPAHGSPPVGAAAGGTLIVGTSGRLGGDYAYYGVTYRLTSIIVIPEPAAVALIMMSCFAIRRHVR
ncbi:MAG: hypothetical protein AAGA92_12595 [Planctomycetota bacterium]